MNKIPLVLASDEKLFFTIGVVAVSLLENAKPDTFYDINILHTSDVKDESKESLLKLQNKYSNFSLKFYDMKDKFKDLKTTQGYHVNYVSAYKMLVPSLLKDYDKVLYLDTDIIVRGDLTELYNIDLGNNYLGGVKFNIDIQTEDNLSKMLEIPNLDYYINAGVILMNLKNIREDKIDEKWMSLLGKYENSVDQHILNKVCWGKIKRLPVKYNVCLSSLKHFFEEDEIASLYSLKETDEALKNPVIFHWTHIYKPWIYSDTFLAGEWLDYYKMITPPPKPNCLFEKEAVF